MSYLHCPTCRCAYNVATQPACPRCGIQAGTPEDPAEAIVAAADRLARAMSRASVEQVARASSLLEQRALPAPGSAVASASPDARTILSAIRTALRPVDSTVPAHQALLTSVAFALVTRLAIPASPPTAKKPPTAITPVVVATAKTASDRLRSWAKARLSGPMHRARALLARAA